MRTSIFFDLGKLRHLRSRLALCEEGARPLRLTTEEMAPDFASAGLLRDGDEAESKLGRKRSPAAGLAFMGLKNRGRCALEYSLRGGYYS